MNDVTLDKTRQTTARRKSTLERPAESASDHRAQIHKPSISASPVAEWLRMSQAELDDVYRHAAPGPVPQGDTKGTPILYALPVRSSLAYLLRKIAWQGKVFDLFAPKYNTGVVVNKVTPFGLNLIVAKVYRGISWLDKRETIVIDYASTSLIAMKIRDEIREVSPGVYLGKVWLGTTRVADFALERPGFTAADHH